MITNKLKALCSKAASVALAAALSTCMVPVSAFAADDVAHASGQTMSVDDKAKTRLSLQSDSTKIAVKVPTNICLAVNGDGTFTAPSPDAVKIVNTSVFSTHVEQVKAELEEGFSFAGSEYNAIELDMAPNGHEPVSLEDFYPDYADIAGNDWDMAMAGQPGDEIRVALAGSIKNVNKDLNDEQEFGSINWVFASGANGLSYGNMTADITGSFDIGESLTANAIDALEGSDLTYQWYRDNVEIEGATSQTYAYQASDDGHTISVKVRATKAGYDKISPATASVIAYGDMTASISGTASVGQTLRVEASNVPTGAMVAYQWYRDDVVISGGTGQEHVYTAEDNGHVLKCVVSANSDTYDYVRPASATRGAYTGMNVTISGSSTYDAGDVLTAAVSNGLEGADYAYQWYRDGAEIAGATSSTYSYRDSDDNHRIKVVVEAAKTGFDAIASASDNFIVHSGMTLEIEGDALVGEELVAAVSGEPDGADPDYQWYRDGVAIEGASGNIYTYQDADEGCVVSCCATVVAEDYAYVRPASDAVSAYSKMTVAIEGTLDNGQTLSARVSGELSGSELSYAWYRDDTAISGATGETYQYASETDDDHEIKVIVSATKEGIETIAPASDAVKVGGSMTAAVVGTVADGSTLTATPANAPAGASYTYQWYRDGAAIPGATGSTYAYNAANDDGHTVSVTVGASADGYDLIRPASASVVTYAGMTVGITGGYADGSTLTATPANAPAGASYTYQWYRDDNAMTGATASTYTYAASADDNKAISVAVSASATGYDRVAPATASIKVHSGMGVKITGTPSAGNTLTATPESAPVGASYSYQWKLDSADISGATGSTISYSSSYYGHTLSVTVNAEAPGYDYVRPATASKKTYSGTSVNVTGYTSPARVEDTLTANVSNSPSGVTSTSYQWYRGSNAISGATSSSYTLVEADEGSTVSVTVTQTASSYDYVVPASASVGEVAAKQTVPQHTSSTDWTVAEMKDAAASLEADGTNSPYYAVMKNYMDNDATFKFGNMEFRIVDLLTAEKQDGTKAGITYMAKKSSLSGTMNSSATNSGGWGNSAMRTSLNSGTLWNQLPDEVKNNAVAVKVEYGPTYNSTAATVSSTYDKVWLPSAMNIWGDGPSSGTYQYYKHEGTQFSYFKNKGVTLSNYSGLVSDFANISASNYVWVRSCGYYYSNNFLYVNRTNGHWYDNFANYSYAVAPCFSI